MAQFQPNGVIMNGSHQNRANAGAIAAQCIGVNLIPHQNGLPGHDFVPGKALPDALGKGFAGVGNTI